jgi:hypothetical protein
VKLDKAGVPQLNDITDNRREHWRASAYPCVRVPAAQNQKCHWFSFTRIALQARVHSYESCHFRHSDCIGVLPAVAHERGISRAAARLGDCPGRTGTVACATLRRRPGASTRPLALAAPAGRAPATHAGHADQGRLTRHAGPVLCTAVFLGARLSRSRPPRLGRPSCVACDRLRRT